MNNEEKNFQKANINWLRTIQSRPTPKPYIIKEKQKKILHVLYKNMLKQIKISKKWIILSKNCLGIDMVRTDSQDRVKKRCFDE